MSGYFDPRYFDSTIFDTGEVTPPTAPTITTTTPTNGGTYRGELNVIFNEDVTLGTGIISISPSVPISTSINENILTINPAGDLNPNTTYTLTLTVNSVYDSTGTEGLASSYEFEFITSSPPVPPPEPVTPIFADMDGNPLAQIELGDIFQGNRANTKSFQILGDSITNITLSSFQYPPSQIPPSIQASTANLGYILLSSDNKSFGSGLTPSGAEEIYITDNVPGDGTPGQFFSGTAPPSHTDSTLTYNYRAGHIMYNSSPSAGDYIGWVCTVAGNPGTWKGFGLIQS